MLKQLQKPTSLGSFRKAILRIIGDKETGYSGYFLIVKDIVDFALNNQIPVGVGRGSAAGSLVAFCLGITDIDPLKYGLIFERF